MDQHDQHMASSDAQSAAFSMTSGPIVNLDFWQQTLRYHHRTTALDDTRLVKIAMLGGYTLGDNQTGTAPTNKSWRFHLGCFLEHYTGQQQLLHSFDIGFIIEKAKHWVAFRFLRDDNHSSHVLYRTLPPEYKHADYLSAVKCYSDRRLLGRIQEWGAMVCMLIQADGKSVSTLIGKTGLLR